MLRKIFKFALYITGFALVITSLFGIFTFIGDVNHLSQFDKSNIELEWAKRTQARFYITSFSDNVQKMALGLLCFFAASQLDTSSAKTNNKLEP